MEINWGMFEEEEAFPANRTLCKPLQGANQSLKQNDRERKIADRIGEVGRVKTCRTL